jgi:hypothetical protein
MTDCEWIVSAVRVAQARRRHERKQAMRRRLRRLVPFRPAATGSARRASPSGA